MKSRNGFPPGGQDYRLSIIGVPKDKTTDLDNNNGRRIFVRLYSDNVVTTPGGKNNQLAKSGNDDQNHSYLCNSTNGEVDVVDARCEAIAPLTRRTSARRSTPHAARRSRRTPYPGRCAVARWPSRQSVRRVLSE